MAEAAAVPTPAAAEWTWGPERAGFGGYAGTCAIGPFTVTVSVKQRFGDGWELRGTVRIAGMKTASHSWETDALSCTPDGIIAEVATRDVVSQLIETTRRRVANAARLLEEFDVISRAWPSHGEEGQPPPDLV
jgi:hypothetical protein